MKSKLAYTGIRVKDLESSVGFYTRLLGMTERGRTTIEGTKGVVVDLVSDGSEHPLELNFYEPGSADGTPYAAGEGLDHLAFQVSDLDRAIAEAASAGYPVVREMRSARSRWAYIQDPNGIWIELFS